MLGSLQTRRLPESAAFGPLKVENYPPGADQPCFWTALYYKRMLYYARYEIRKE